MPALFMMSPIQTCGHKVTRGYSHVESLLTNEEQKILNTFATYASLVYDVTDTDLCSCGHKVTTLKATSSQL